MFWPELKNNPRQREIFEARIKIIKLTREFFWSCGFSETETPIALRYPGQEPYLNPISVLFHNPVNEAYKFYLQTSPEFAMKKLLVAGYEKIFQICKCFRDFEQFGGNHNIEFTMLEWYRAPGTIEEIMDDTEGLFKFVGHELKVKNLKFKDCEINIFAQWDRLSMRQVWKKFIGIELNDYLTVGKMQELVNERGYNFQSEVYEDLFYKIFLNEIESKLGTEKPVIIYDYPEQMCSLSRLSKKDPCYAERFELYIAGLELANAFGELTDAVKQKKLLEEDKEKRIQLGKEIWPVDSGFIAALESGMPEAGGIALGLDRMIMIFTGTNNINDVIFQAVDDVIDKPFKKS